MINLTPNKLIDYVKDYDYEINIEQSKEILELLYDTMGIFKSDDIQMATDYILNGQDSIYANYF